MTGQFLKRESVLVAQLQQPLADVLGVGFQLRRPTEVPGSLLDGLLRPQ